MKIMLKVNVGLSRKVSRDYQSTGFSVNLEGEITAPASDPEAVIEQVKEVFDLAEAALDAQIERSQGTAAIGSHDEETPAARNSNGNGRNAAPDNGQRNTAANGNGRKEEPATNKQVQFILSIGKRMKLSTAALEKEVAEILGTEVGLYDLTKRQAATVLDQLTASTSSNRE
jgi:hypothetical protein